MPHSIIFKFDQKILLPSILKKLIILNLLGKKCLTFLLHLLQFLSCLLLKQVWFWKGFEKIYPSKRWHKIQIEVFIFDEIRQYKLLLVNRTWWSWHPRLRIPLNKTFPYKNMLPPPIHQVRKHPPKMPAPSQVGSSQRSALWRHVENQYNSSTCLDPLTYLANVFYMNKLQQIRICFKFSFQQVMPVTRV